MGIDKAVLGDNHPDLDGVWRARCKERGRQKMTAKPTSFMRVIFSDTMRYGRMLLSHILLINNPWRNWGPVGQRVPVPTQMEFEWGYLWAEIDVLSGDINVWLLPEMNGEVSSRENPTKVGRKYSDSLG